MYAIFRAGGFQFRAEADQTLRLPTMQAKPGDRVTFDEVLLTSADGKVHVGTPVIDGASVAAEVVRHGRGDKVIVYKMKRRKGYRKKQGHRQGFTEVRVVEIDFPTGDSRRAKKSKPSPKKSAAPVEATGIAAGEPEVEITDAAAELAEEEGIDVTEIQGSGAEGRVLKADVEQAAAERIDITDAARELAEENGIDLASLEGSGKDGRILKSDVEAAIKEREG